MALARRSRLARGRTGCSCRGRIQICPIRGAGSVLWVLASFRFSRYEPSQKKLFPGARSMPRISMLRLLKTASCSGPKSSPTTAITRTSVKKLAASAKCVAAPPRQRSCRPAGVSIESNATLPTTVIAIPVPHLPVPLSYVTCCPRTLAHVYADGVCRIAAPRPDIFRTAISACPLLLQESYPAG